MADKDSVTMPTLVVLWLTAFVVCATSVASAYMVIPNLRNELVGETIVAFAPLSVMLGFVFSRKTDRWKRKRDPLTSLLALAVSLIYLSFVVVPAILFALERLSGSELLSTIRLVSTATMFLVSGAISYYFGKS